MSDDLEADEARLKDAENVEILRRIQEDPDRVLRSLMGCYDKFLYWAIRKNGADHDTAVDVLQDVWLVVLNKGHTFDASKGSLGGWLKCVAQRKSIDTIRKRARYSRLMDKAEEQQKHHEAIEDSRPLETPSETTDRQHVLETAMDELPEQQRVAVELAYLKGMTQREIARHLNVSLPTIKTRLALGLSKLKSLIKAA